MGRKLSLWGGGVKMDDMRQLAGGAIENDWTGTSTGDINQWATTIFETEVKSTVLLPHVVRYDAPRTVNVPTTTRQSSTWVTGKGNAATHGTTNYDMTDIVLSPVQYRTLMMINREALEIATWSVEADVRKRLAYRTALKLDNLCYTGFDDAAALSSSGTFTVAGSAMDTNGATNVDAGTALSVDNILDAIDYIDQNDYHANTIIIPPAWHADLRKESTFINAAEHGDASVIRTGKIANFVGCDIYVSSNIPVDLVGAAVGFVFDDTSAIVANVPHEFDLESHLYWRTDNIEFCASLRGVAKQLDEKAAVTLY